jgi:uncharacterized SAM-binding protein YcdF (DUF218 family)
VKILSGLLKLLILLAILAIPLYVFHGLILNKAAKYLYYRDELKPADVIVVIPCSETEYSVAQGAKLFKEGWARKDKIMLSGGNAIWKYTWSSLMKEQALSLGVPEHAISLEEKSNSTKENAIFTKDIIKKHRYTSLILVTSPYHSKRANKIFRKIMGNEIKVLSAPSEEGRFQFQGWWKREKDRKAVLTEFFKVVLFYVFGG